MSTTSSGEAGRTTPAAHRIRATRVTIRYAGTVDPGANSSEGRRIRVERPAELVSSAQLPASSWRRPPDRALFPLAGLLILLGVGLALVSPWFLLIPTVVAVGELGYLVIGSDRS